MASILNLIGAPDTNHVTVVLNRGNVSDSLMSFEGNNALVEYLNIQMHADNIVLGGRIPKEIKIQKPLLILNSICNPDTHTKTLKVANEIVRNMHIPIINRPDLVMKTKKDQIYVLFKDLEGLSVPQTIRIAPKRLSDIDITINKGIMDYPFIFQPIVDSQAHHNVQLIEEDDQLHDLERFAFDGRDYYVSEFIDYRSTDGYFRKYRVVIINGKPYPRDMMISEEWISDIRNGRKLIESNPVFRDEEEVFLQSEDKALNVLFRQIYKILPLDYFVLEFGFNEEKKPLIFEISSCTRTILYPIESTSFDYHNQRTREIKEAFIDMINERLKP